MNPLTASEVARDIYNRTLYGNSYKPWNYPSHNPRRWVLANDTNPNVDLFADANNPKHWGIAPKGLGPKAVKNLRPYNGHAHLEVYGELFAPFMDTYDKLNS